MQDENAMKVIRTIFTQKITMKSIFEILGRLPDQTLNNLSADLKAIDEADKEKKTRPDNG